MPSDALERLATDILVAGAGRGLTVATAESCTAGGIAAALAAIPGSSRILAGGVVAYDNRIKTKLLGVDARLLAEEGAVSAAVASQMARGGAYYLETDLCVSSTGIAGPDGGSPDKPVGTVYIAVCYRRRVVCEKLELRGGRRAIQARATRCALELLLRVILHPPA